MFLKRRFYFFSFFFLVTIIFFAHFSYEFVGLLFTGFQELFTQLQETYGLARAALKRLSLQEERAQPGTGRRGPGKGMS